MLGLKDKFRFLLFPFSFFYWGITIWRNLFYSVGFFVSKRLPVSTISVGNITMGGTGKTPTVIALAEILLQMNQRPAIVSRGYGRSTTGCVTVSDGEKILVEWKKAGDEPFLIAKRLPNVPVIVDEEKYRGGMLAIEKFNVNAVIFDDAFQHRAVERDLDIILINSSEPAGHYRMIPYGRLREPTWSVMRADLIIWSRADSSVAPPSIVRKLTPHIRQSVMSGLKTQSTIELNGLKVVAFCGIGDPNSFLGVLEQKGVEVLGFQTFPDHHPYTGEEIKELKTEARRCKADALVTSEKDWVKLPTEAKNSAFIIPVPIEILWLKNGEAILTDVLKRLF